MIYDYLGEDSEIIIPSTIDNKPVTAIARNTFDGDYAYLINTVWIPESVTRIEEYAFVNCVNLINITIPESVTYIGPYAFQNCSKLTDISIPDSVTSIYGNTFQGCTELESITIPNSITSIANSAFKDCTSLKSIILPDSIVDIGDSVFENCIELTDITISKGIASIGWNAFSGTKWLEDKRAESPLVIVDNYLIDGKGCSGTVIIPDNVTVMAGGAFNECTDSINIVISDSMITIPWRAFSGCTSLASITLSDSVTRIAEYAFSDCTSLKSVVIPKSLTSIEYSVFKGCTNLEDITIPETVTSIDGSAFFGTKWLSNKQNENALVIVNNILVNGQTCSGDVVIPNNVTKLGDSAFEDCTELTNITIPNSVTSIRNSVFKGCTRLIINCTKDSYAYQYAMENEIDVRIICQHTNIEQRNKRASNCKEEGYTGDTYCKDCDTVLSSGTAISKVEHTWDAGVITTQATVSAEGVKTYTCTVCGETRTETIAKLEDNTHEEVIQNGSEVIVSKLTYTVTDVKKATVTCTGNSDKKATTITIPGTVKIQGRKYKVTKIADNAFKNNKKIKKVTIGSNVTSVGKNAFKGCTNLKTLTLGKKVKSIGNSAFEGCKKLTKVTLAKNVTTIGSKAFYKCKKLKTVTVETSKLKTVGKNAFAKIANNAKFKFKKSIPASKREKYLKLFK